MSIEKGRITVELKRMEEKERLNEIDS